MHAKHPARMPGRGLLPGPTAHRVRHVWGWNVKRDMAGEKRHRVFQVLRAEPDGSEWASNANERRGLPVKVDTFKLALQPVKRLGRGFVMLTRATAERANGARPQAGPDTWVGHMAQCGQCSSGKPCLYGKVRFGAV